MSNNVNVVVSASTSQFSAGLAQVQNKLDAFKAHANGQLADLGRSFLSVFAVGSIIAGIKSLLDEFGRLQDLSDRLDESAESLQRIGEAAKLSGTDLETVIKGMQKASNNAFAAIEGNTGFADSFTALGTTAEAFVNLSTEEKLVALSKGFQDGGSNAELLRAAMEILGKSGAELAPLLGQGPEALKKQLQEAAVATDETVQALAQAGDKIDKTFSNIKAAGATALAFIIDKVQVLWGGLNTLGVFLANLPDGFKAASQAADDFSKDFFASREKEQNPEPKKKVDVEAIQAKAEAAGKANDDQKKAEADLAKLQDENIKKEHDAYLRSLSLLEKKAELQRELLNLEIQASAITDDVEREKNKGKQLDVKADLEGVNKEIAREDERVAKERTDKAKKDAADKAKAELQAKKDALKGAETTLDKLSNNNTGFSVDSLRAIGGGIAGANYSIAAQKDDMQRQQVDYQRQTVEQLRQVVSKLEQSSVPTTFDGSFS